MDTLRSLTKLHLDFFYCLVTTLGKLSTTIGSLVELTNLTMVFVGCQNLTTLGMLGASIRALRKLDYLRLDFENCSSLTTLGELGASLESFRAENVYVVTLDFRGCWKLNSQAHNRRFKGRDQLVDFLSTSD